MARQATEPRGVSRVPSVGTDAFAANETNHPSLRCVFPHEIQEPIMTYGVLLQDPLTRTHFLLPRNRDRTVRCISLKPIRQTDAIFGWIFSAASRTGPFSSTTFQTT